MLEFNEKEKTFIYSEIWSIADVKLIFDDMGIYQQKLTDDEFFQILKNAGEKAYIWQENLSLVKIEDEINKYMEENY